MKKIVALILLSLCCLPAFAQPQVQKGQYATYTSTVEKRGDQVLVTIQADMHGTHLRRQQMVSITPTIVSTDRKEVRSFAPVTVAGPKRYKMVNRLEGFGKYQFDPKPRSFTKFKNRKGDSFTFNLSMPYEAWMRDASLNVIEKLSCCPNSGIESDKLTAYAPVLPPIFVPEYRVSYVVPPAEQIKQRSETHVSHISYEVGKATILRNFKDNARMLDDVDRIMNELKNDKNLTLNDFTVTGYASPDGYFYSNLELSEKRAQAFLNYLRQHYGMNVSSIHAVGRGEDWEGLYKAIEKSHLYDRAQLLSIIDNTYDIAQRKTAIRALSGGQTYRTLLDQYFPPLRRNEYEISYVARPFNVEEAKGLIRTKPQQLSLNEMYLVANTYPKGSDDFKYVFDVAARMYPDDPYANVNSGALEIESGAYDTAIRRMEGIQSAEALNNLGVAYVKKGDTARATAYFRQASTLGNADARYNLDQLEKFLAN